MTENFDSSKSTPEQRRKGIEPVRENRNRLQKLMQYHIQRQRERFEMLSNTLSSISEPKNDNE